MTSSHLIPGKLYEIVGDLFYFYKGESLNDLVPRNEILMFVQIIKEFDNLDCHVFLHKNHQIYVFDQPNFSHITNALKQI